MSLAADAPRAHFGLIGFFFGVVALLAAAIMTSGMLMPETQQSIGTSIGEIARDIKAAATGAFTESAASPEPAPFDPTKLLAIVTPVLAAIAVILGGVSVYREEPTSLPKLAIGFGLGAVAMQYVFWMALLICGAVIVTAIISNMDSIFDI